jgi:hypothetical protein
MRASLLTLGDSAAYSYEVDVLIPLAGSDNLRHLLSPTILQILPRNRTHGIHRTFESRISSGVDQKAMCYFTHATFSNVLLYSCYFFATKKISKIQKNIYNIRYSYHAHTTTTLLSLSFSLSLSLSLCSPTALNIEHLMRILMGGSPPDAPNLWSDYSPA